MKTRFFVVVLLSLAVCRSAGARLDVQVYLYVTLTETALQRTSEVTIVPNGIVCEMQVVSNYSGVAHNDREAFKKRMDEALVEPKDLKPTEPATPVTT
jgi:hypothetical protein